MGEVDPGVVPVVQDPGRSPALLKVAAAFLVGIGAARRRRMGRGGGVGGLYHRSFGGRRGREARARRNLIHWWKWRWISKWEASFESLSEVGEDFIRENVGGGCL